MFKFQTVFLVAALLTFSTVQADDDDQGFYQPADGICSKCNCTTVNGTIQSGESGRLLTLDCSMKGYEKLFAGWPEEMGDNHTGNSIRTVEEYSLSVFNSQMSKLFTSCR